MTSNGGVIWVRELDERLGFSELIEEHLTDSRANNEQFTWGIYCSSRCTVARLDTRM